jgi:hypothetical protein
MNAEAEPPDGELAEAIQAGRGGEGDAIVSVRMANGTPNSLNVRSKTAKAKGACVVASASHASRYRLAKSVIVSG